MHEQHQCHYTTANAVNLMKLQHMFSSCKLSIIFIFRSMPSYGDDGLYLTAKHYAIFVLD